MQIGVNHPSPSSPDLESTSSSFSPGGTVQQLMQGALHWRGEDSDEDDEDDEEDEEGDNDGKRSTLTPVSTFLQYIHTFFSHTYTHENVFLVDDKFSVCTTMHVKYRTFLESNSFQRTTRKQEGRDSLAFQLVIPLPQFLDC